MVEETITLISLEPKKTKAGAEMWTAETSQGKMSVFDKTLAEDMQKVLGKNLVVNVTIQGQYKNIASVVGLAPNQTPMAAPVKAEENPREKRVSYCISYAKDLVVGKAIELKDFEKSAEDILKLYERMLVMK